MAADYNYGEALQKSILFYEFQRAGDLPEDEMRNNWRGDSVLNDGADVELDLSKGWFDAGDHVKFNLPMAYTVTMLSWAAYEYPEAFEDSGQMEYLKKEIKWATDYLINCHPEPNVFYYQVGDGNADHKWWGPAEAVEAELQEGDMGIRPSHKVTSSSPGSAVVGEAAAAMASASIIFEDSDPAYSAELLSHAKELFEFADSTRSDEGYTEADGFYDSWSGYWDELAWSAAWLYMATDDDEYLTRATEYVDNFGKKQQTDIIAYGWGHCWDDKTYGAALLLAKATGDERYKSIIENNLDFWTVGYNGEKIKYTPGGLAWLDQWGSLRYATTTAFLASVYADWEDADPEKVPTYEEFAKSQVDFALGSTGRSFVIGFGENPPEHPHHRTAHGSWADKSSIPENHRHTLYGALVGGPGQDGSYTDEIDDYVSNEVANDYNAGFVGALAKMYSVYGGEPIPDFKANEEVTMDEYFVQASINSTGDNYIEIKAIVNNRSGWPATVTEEMSFRYFVDLSEIFDAGYTTEDFTTEVKSFNNSVAEITGPHAWDEENDIYYFEVDMTGSVFYPGGQSEYKKEIQFRMSAPLGVNWDNSNDYSYQGLGETAQDVQKTPYIPLYNAGRKLFGSLPGEPTNSIESPDLDGNVDDNNYVELSWDSVENAEGYKVKYWQKSDSSYGDTIDVDDITSYTVNNLPLGYTYCFEVIAYNEGTQSEPSNIIEHSLVSDDDDGNGDDDNDNGDDDSGDDLYERGDVNEDGYRDSLDTTLLRRYLIGSVSENEINSHAADMDQSGDINSLDLTVLNRELLGD